MKGRKAFSEICCRFVFHREKCAEAGITQGTLADLIGTSSRTVHAIETGTGNPSLVTVAAAANAVGLRLKATDA